MTKVDGETSDPTASGPTALELYDEWETYGYDVAGPIPPEREVEWSVVTRLYDLKLATDRQLSSDLGDLIREGAFEGAFKYWGGLNWHDSVPEDPNKAGRTDPRELAILKIGVECAKEAHGAFKDLELEPVPEVVEGEFSAWLEVVGRNAETIDRLVKEQFPYLDWQPGFEYLNVWVSQAHRQIEPYQH